MTQDLILFNKFASSIKSLPNHTPLTKADLLIPEFQLLKDGSTEIYYAPFDYVNENARIILVGITPGWTQMEISYRCAKQYLLDSLSPTEVCRRAKQHASFAGSMRKNLISMLDEVRLPTLFGIESSELLFSDYRPLLHTTSVIRYPVFINGFNYTGHSPNLLKTDSFRRFATEMLTEELQRVRNAIIIPLGKTVSDVVQVLADEGVIEFNRCCMGFPHPSGANGHRRSHFVKRQLEIKQKLDEWFVKTPLTHVENL